MADILSVQEKAIDALRKAVSSRSLRKLLAQRPRSDRVHLQKYEVGDWVYFRRPVAHKGDNPFRGPGQVVGTLPHCVIVTFGNHLFHVHPVGAWRLASVKSSLKLRGDRPR